MATIPNVIVDTNVWSEAFRKKGLGKTVLNFTKEHARKRGARSVRLEVETYNGGAKALYEREGFKVNPRIMMDCAELDLPDN